MANEMLEQKTDEVLISYKEICDVIKYYQNAEEKFNNWSNAYRQTYNILNQLKQKRDNAYNALNDMLLKLVTNFDQVIEQKEDSSDEDDRSALEFSKTNWIRDMLEAGANPNYENKNYEPVFIVSARKGHGAVIQLFIENSSTKLSATGTIGDTALSWLACHEDSSLIECLINKYRKRYGTPKLKNYIDKFTEYGRTALMCAAVSGHLNVVKTLVEAGANINLTCEDRKTAQQYAEDHSHTEISDFLAEWTNKANKKRRREEDESKKEADTKRKCLAIDSLFFQPALQADQIFLSTNSVDNNEISAASNHSSDLTITR